MFSTRLQQLHGSQIREILALTRRPEVISFAGGLPAPEMLAALPVVAWPGELGQYGCTEGEPELRERVAAYVSGLGRECHADQVLITSGSQQGLDLAAKLFIDPGTPVAVEAPSYLAALQVFRLFGAHFLSLPVGAEGLDPARLERLLVRERPALVYLNPTFQNPAGMCYSRATREAVAEVLARHRAVLLEDDPYRELRYDPVDTTPICAGLEDSPWLYAGSFSKIGLPGLRVGYLVASKDLFGHLVRLKQCTDLHSNRPGQWWCSEFLASPQRSAHLETLRATYRAKRDAMAASLERHCTDLAEWRVPAGGLFFWVRMRHACDTQQLLREALARNVAFMPGEPFFAEAPVGESWLRLNFSHSDGARIETGVAALARAMESVSGHVSMEVPE